ncbi:MAG: zf-HC2 domain-containing protein, partial [Gemmatimonadota bacterium]
MTEKSCTRAEPDAVGDDVVEDYVAGRLSEAEAEAFEAHYFECDACWGRVRGALELYAAFSERPAAGPADAGSSAAGGRAGRGRRGGGSCRRAGPGPPWPRRSDPRRRTGASRPAPPRAARGPRPPGTARRASPSSFPLLRFLRRGVHEPLQVGHRQVAQRLRRVAALQEGDEPSAGGGPGPPGQL